MEDVKNFITENRSYCIAFVVVIVLCAAGAWLVHDFHRNDTEYHNTDSTVAELENRINDLESRIGTMQKRLEDTQKTVSTINRRIDTSTGLAIEIESGIGVAEERLEVAIQRSERIKNLITEIENGNQP